MEKEHEWLLIGSGHTGVAVLRMFMFRCKGCLIEDIGFKADEPPPKKRHKLDKCQDDSLHRLKNLASKRDA